jgi:glycine/D-amino acid oxidase-like deaminating enzyme
LVQKTERIGTTKTTAQLHPYKFCQTLIEEAESRGAKVRIASVEGLIFDKYKITAVRLNDDVLLPVDTIVVAMGPWSGPCLQWLVKQGGRMYSLPDVNGQRAHSLLLRPSIPISPHICFVELSLGHKFSEPEFYPRPDGNVFVSGEIDEGALPESASESKANPTSIKNLKRDCSLLSPEILGTATVVKENCCWMPISSDTLPLIGKVPWLDGVYVATGHSVWGISNSAGTGLVIAEMIVMGQAQSIDVRALAPLRPKNSRVHS